MAERLASGKWLDDCPERHQHPNISTMYAHLEQLHRDDPEHYNYWGTLKSTIDSDEFCVECEREVPNHYECCTL